MSVKLWLAEAPQFLDGNGAPYSNAPLFFYAAGSSTKQDTFTDSTGATPNANPMYTDANGRLAQAVWLTVGLLYKIGLAEPGQSDPPTSFVPPWPIDNVAGINDSTVTLDEWVTGPAPTYVSATSFTVVGDQTSLLTVGRRVKISDSGGTKYGTIKTSVFGALTTITLDSQDSDALATPTSSLSYGLFNPANTSHPVMSDAIALVGGSADRSKRVRVEADGITTATTRVWTAQDKSITVPGIDDLAMDMCEGRLTLTTAVPVTTADVTAAETIYFTPYKGAKIALYDGSVWRQYTFTEISGDVPDAAQMNDVFVYLNAGVMTLDIVAWTNDTTRATALATQNGVLVKTGATSRRYVGSFYSNTTGNGQTEDSKANRFVWNYYNRVRRVLRNVTETADSWTYTTATIRQARASTANQLNFVVGVDEDAISAAVTVGVQNDNPGVEVQVSIGLDSTTAMSADCYHGHTIVPVANIPTISSATFYGLAGIGKHFLSWNEYSAAAGTTTWHGDATAPSRIQAGIHGEILA